MLGYALGRRGASPAEQRQGYRGHFERMGFGDALARLEEMRDKGASRDALVDAFPPELARRVGYFGPPPGPKTPSAPSPRASTSPSSASSPPAPGPHAVIETMAACRPALRAP